jgi:hypothetical protein
MNLIPKISVRVNKAVQGLNSIFFIKIFSIFFGEISEVLLDCDAIRHPVKGCHMSCLLSCSATLVTVGI